MLLLAQVAPALADSVAGANPVLTPIAAPDEMNLWSMAVKGGWIMVVLGVLSVVCFYILFERNYVIRKAGNVETSAAPYCSENSLRIAGKIDQTLVAFIIHFMGRILATKR